MALDSNWIDRLTLLQPILNPDALPSKVLAQAIADNPWFSEADIRQSLSALRGWLEPDSLAAFLNRYPKTTSSPVKIGVIAAGNLPLVCFHDVLCVLLSGQQLYLKPATQDKALITWIRDAWCEKLPEIGKTFHLSGNLPKTDLLIATGSNNTARHLKDSYGDIPHLIRKNRFSVALIGPDTTQEDLMALQSDIFSYNGLGCRNVSHALLLPGFSKTNWEESLRSFPIDRLHPLYLERYLIERVRKSMMREPFFDMGSILRVPSQNLKYAAMAVIHELELNSLEEAELHCLQHQDQIQCIVGKDVPYGQSQSPDIHDFADGVDTIRWILRQLERIQAG